MRIMAEERMREIMRVAAVVEEERRNDMVEIQTLREQMVQFRGEYVQYKGETERLENALGNAEEQLNSQVRALQERDKDQVARIHELENINNDISA
jgi:ribosome-associated translation inhibitor RaiA